MVPAKRQMWADAHSLTQEAWARALEAEGDEYANGVVTAAANALCAARRFNESFVGGNDTSCLLQLLALSREDGASETDVLASVLLPLDEVEIAYTARGQEAYRLLCSFWTWSPTSPALISSGGKYHQLMCKVPLQDWTEGALCPARVATLQAQAFSELRLYVAGEENDAERERAAICRR
jgi:hypothetical protein